MLTKLFSSQVRVKILKFLIMHSEQSFSAGEIAGGTGSAIRSVNKEIDKLLEAGAVIEELQTIQVNKKAVKVKHYRVNNNFVIFDEVKNLFIKMQTLDSEDFREKMKKSGKINYVVLTGNFVGSKESAIDLLIVGGISHKNCEGIVKSFEKKIGWEINWTLMDLPEYDYRQKIGDMFLYELMKSRKIELISKFV
ncbi:hypothetical protein COT99_02100 [Candidatus Falkowbacteria bacterium CG10_big_fil_rev_8_21_14_0_10_43_10]|uniref:ArsR family transcriptional regulator n=1 Tax=Candidatus Falkowbacteria bacterium CG10_big_fil_rev_8_21_14_0_10_43_10 TaxID=1974567 RepID=A0A2H0V2A4_9BACT|nr:MAG: hypothetical protein COT99_02100 [Candidatus Falkowbacteria bacterium CG10_big_fil_rev_8_21_14_0_10_43_10]